MTTVSIKKASHALLGMALALCATNALAASNSQGTIWDFEQYNPSPRTVAQFSDTAPYSELYPIEATPDALEAAISQFYEHGEAPSDKLLALIKGPVLYLQINGNEYVLKRTRQSIVSVEGRGITEYSACDYPQQDDERTELFINTRDKLSVEVHTLHERYFAMAYSPVHKGYRDLKLPAECLQTERYNSFSKGYAKLFKDGVLKATITILRQDLQGSTTNSEN